MLYHFLLNLLIVFFMLSLFVGVYLFFCRDYRHFNGILKKDDRKLSDAFLTRFYFVLTTFTTIGYGDITPKSTRARVITVFIILLIMIVILKAFDSLISTYHGVFDKYTKELETDAKNVLNTVKPIK